MIETLSGPVEALATALAAATVKVRSSEGRMALDRAVNAIRTVSATFEEFSGR